MEAAFFRHLVRELAATLAPRRIEKVYEPSPGLWVLRIGSGPGGRHLVFRPRRSAGLLFLCDQIPENPGQPSAQAMWWRKRLKNRRIVGVVSDWQRLRLALALSGAPGEHLVLDVRQSMSLVPELEADFGMLAKDYPSRDEILASDEIFRTLPHVSPPLRKRIARLSPEEGERLLQRLQNADPEGFFIHPSGKGPGRVLCWPALDQGAGRFDSALAAAAGVGGPEVFGQVGDNRERVVQSQGRRDLKRIRRALDRLDQEQERLERWRAERLFGLALQANLYQLQDSDGLASARLPGPEGREVEVPLDPTLSPVENMQMFFHRAARAERGLARLAERRAELEAQRLRGEVQEGAPPAPAAQIAGKGAVGQGAAGRSPVPARFRNAAVAVFDSSEGFLILRGKNAKANDELVKRASPFDYWLHAAGAPGAHVLLRRDHPSVEVPEQSLREAAILAALKSGAARDASADVLCAQARHVRKIKGAAAGAVSLDVARTLRVELDPGLERRLARAFDPG
ncbi:MAG: NFACT RNA binding domain-containing protein [Desulfovibrionaceae bacterium]